MSVFFVSDESRITIRGKTYPYRELIRSMGGQYEAVEKVWTLTYSAENLQKVTDFCKRVGGGAEKSPAWPPTAASAPVMGATAAPLEDAVLPTLGTAAPWSAETSDGYTIAEVMQKSQLAISQTFPRSIWVLGEVQNIRWHASGVYLQLADFKEGASKSATVTVNATIWNTALRELERRFGRDEMKELLQDGIRLRVLVDVSFFKDRGQLSLQIQGIDPNYTKGSLALAREKLLRELRAKGVDRMQKALRLAAFPFRVGLLSAEDSRAKSDFLDQLQVYGFPGEVIFYPAQMQGENTLRDVVAGLQEMERRGCDLIVVTRGGGSAADLRWFDSPEIAYAIAGTKVPVIAAIGHHEDVCIAEEICYQREKTPTAAADFILTHFARTRERMDALAVALSQKLGDRIKLFDASLIQMREKIRGTAATVIHDQTRMLDQMAAQVELQGQRRLFFWSSRLDQAVAGIQRAAETRWGQMLARVQETAGKMELAVERGLIGMRGKLDAIEAQIQRADPQPWMKQGWTQLFDANGTIRSGARVKAGAKIRARLPDALLDLTVDDVKERGNENDGK